MAATNTLNDMIDHCPPAAACKDAFDRMSKATVQMCMATTGFGPTAIRSQKKDPGASSTAVLRTPGLVRAVSFASTRHSGGQVNSGRFDMNLNDLFLETDTNLQTINRPNYGEETLNLYNQPQAIEPPSQRQSSTQYRPVSQPLPEEYQQTVRPIVNTPDVLDYNAAIPTHPSISPYAQRQHAPERFLQQDAYPSTNSTLPFSLEAHPSSSSGFATGPSLPNEMSFELEGFEAFNDADFDFNNLNSMIAGGANLYHGGRDAALWEDGGWSAGSTGAGGEDQSGIAGAGIEGSAEMSVSGSAHAGRNSGGNGNVDMFDGLFFG